MSTSPTLQSIALSAPEPSTAVGFPVNVPPWALDLVGQLNPALTAAKLIIAAGMAPRGYDKPEQIVVACAMGARLGLDPFASMAGISVINNRPTVWGDTMLAVCQNSPAWGGMKVERTGDGDTYAVRVIVTRKGTEPSVGEFSMADAKKAGLQGKQGPWSQYPKRMVELRARAFALRAAFADTLAGFHATEEINDEPREVEATVHAEPKPAKRRTISADAAPAVEHSAETTGQTAQDEKADDECAAAEKAASGKTLGEHAADAGIPADKQPVTVAACQTEFGKLWKLSADGKTAAASILKSWKIERVSELEGATADDREAFLAEVGEALAKMDGAK